jgi:ATP-dependent helicase/nuclease subunit A
MSDFTPQQEAAIRGRGNLLVMAGAGTGKTRTLVGRCLRLVAAERVSLENILMVTFTEAAAAELRGRLRENLRALQAAQPDDEHLAQQLALLDTARVSTLHSFCLQLAREHFHELGLDPQFVVLDEQQTRPLQREALDALLEQHYAGADESSRAVRELIRAPGRGADQVVRQLVLKLHAYAQSLPDPERRLRELEARFAQPEPAEWRVLFQQAANAWRREGLEELKAFANAAPAVGLCLQALASLPADPTPEQIAAAVRAVVRANADDTNWPRGTKGRVRDKLQEFFDDAEFLASLLPDEPGPDPLAQDWEWARPHVVTLVRLTRAFAKDFADRKRELGGVDFADLEQCALRLLRQPGTGAPTATARAWRERLTHIFVDEYQDINAAQDAILTALSRDAGGPAAGNRFLVGDVKQSIYRFRLANPRIFQRYAREWSHAAGRVSPGAAGVDTPETGAHRPEGETISLTENFRSRAALLDFVNPLFAALMRGEIGGVAYEPLAFGAPARRAALAVKAGDPPCAEFHLIARGEPESDEGETDEAAGAPDLLAVEREARLAARRLRELQERGQQVWDDKRQAFRPVEWRDMAVLLRSPAGRAEAFAMEFNKAGVPLTAARDGFFASLEVADLLNLLKLLDNPLQDVPLLAVLRSPLVGLSLDELAEVRAHSAAKPFWTALARFRAGKPAAGVPDPERAALIAKVETFLTRFSRWRELVRQTSLSQCLEAALTETHYEVMLLAGDRGVERAANVRRLLDLARQFDPYQRQGLYRFLRFVRAQEDEALDLQPASPPTENAVKLLSIHKSKGLEFPIVVLAGLGTRFNEGDLRGPVLLHDTLGLCPRITPPGADQSYPGLTHWLARRAERRELRGEELRLFYVALTRARDALILIGTTNQKADEARWASEPPTPIGTKAVADARSHLDWLRLWLPRATAREDWRTDRAGENRLLRWRIYDESDACFAEAPPTPPAPVAGEAGGPADAAAAVGTLQSRLAWRYPFAAATLRAAKTSVSELRRRAAAELEEEAARMFQSKIRSPTLQAASPPAAARLPAAERGTAHHTFLELVELARTGSEAELRAEAERLQQEGLLTAAQAGALDFEALAAFWRSEVGKHIRARAEWVRRELEFTARFAPAELDEITRSPAAELDGEFIVVQGVADLVVLLPEEIWLLDFKTDDVTPAEVESRAAFYAPQVKLYARALGRIYRRPVTNAWLHFLARAETRALQLPPARAAGQAET